LPDELSKIAPLEAKTAAYLPQLGVNYEIDMMASVR
jgi:hypothetical protein